MKIISVVDIRKSGKTTTVEVLIEELKKRGYRVGTVKTINCPLFEIEEDAKSNTRMHKKAGADVVCASAKGETTFIYSEGIGQNRIFEKMKDQVDYLILEGDYPSDVPRIICAHEEEELPARINAHTFLISGRLADRQDSALGYPAISALKDRTGLVEKVLECAVNVSLPVTLSPIPKEAVTFCQHACKKACEQAQKDKEDTARNGSRGTPRHIFLTGEKQIGKSTIWKKVLEELGVEYQGFRTFPFEINGERRGFYIHSFGPVPEGYVNDVPISSRAKPVGAIPVSDAFDTFGADVLYQAAASENENIILIDELGRLERNAKKFQEAAIKCLDSGKLVIGVLQKTESGFLEGIKKRSDVEVFVVTEENRELLPDQLIKLIRERMRNVE